MRIEKAKDQLFKSLSRTWKYVFLRRVLGLAWLCTFVSATFTDVESEDLGTPSVTILDTILFESPILRLHAWGPNFSVLEHSGTFTSFDSAGQAIHRLQFGDIEIFDDFAVIPTHQKLALYRNRDVNSFAFDWSAIKLRIRSLLGARSTVQMINLDDGEQLPPYEFQGNIIAADFDLKVGKGALLVNRERECEVRTFDIHSGTTLHREVIGCRLYEVVLTPSRLFLWGSKRIIELHVWDSGDVKKKVHYPRPSPSYFFWMFDRQGDHKTLTVLNDSVEASWGPIELKSGLKSFSTMVDFWYDNIDSRCIYDYSASTHELFMSAGHKLAVVKLESDEIDFYDVPKVLRLREPVRVIPVTGNRCGDIVGSCG